jgi:hypothetical protein
MGLCNGCKYCSHQITHTPTRDALQLLLALWTLGNLTLKIFLQVRNGSFLIGPVDMRESRALAQYGSGGRRHSHGGDRPSS